MDRTLTDPVLGRVLDGRYRVDARVARGGMSTVYEAVDLRLDRKVAIKVMHPALAEDDDFVARFNREARSAARLSHPNVVSVFDQGEDHGSVFLAMEYVEGRTLRELLRQRGRLTPAEALAVLDPVLAALAAAHDAGIIHRDIKPENVLLADDGRVKVADFGLARAASAATTSQATQGVLIGTVAYLSPEQVERGIADARSDVYAAGILLYEMVTGSTPYTGETPLAVAYKHVHEQVPRPSTVVPGLPGAIDALVQSATNRDPELRPGDAGRYLALVRRVGSELGAAGQLTHPLNETLVVPMPDRGAVVAAPGGPPRTPTGPPPRPRRSRRGLITLLLVVLLAAGVGGTAWWMGSARWTTTPSVLGKDQATAQQILTGAGLKGRVAADGKFDETVPAGLVLSSNPDPQARVKKGSTVVLVLSKGPERYQVPDVTGKTIDEANALLAAQNLVLGTHVDEYSKTVAAGKIIREDPAPTTAVKRGTAVNVAVSKGLQPVQVPAVIGKSYDDAAKALAARNLKARNASQAYSDTVPAGAVISQSQPPGATVAQGTTVDLVVSQGPPLVPVPSVIDKKLNEAQQILQAAGFQVNVNKPPVLVLNRVIAQSPGGGSAPKGSTVTITVF